MIPVYQTLNAANGKRPGPVFPTMDATQGQGNCLAACIASLMEIPLDDELAHILDETPSDSTQWFTPMQEYLKRFNRTLLQVSLPEDIKIATVVPNCYYIALGATTRTYPVHACVGFNGAIVHDPFKGGTGLVGEPLYYLFILDTCKGRN